MVERLFADTELEHAKKASFECIDRYFSKRADSKCGDSEHSDDSGHDIDNIKHDITSIVVKMGIAMRTKSGDVPFLREAADPVNYIAGLILKDVKNNKNEKRNAEMRFARECFAKELGLLNELLAALNTASVAQRTRT